MPRYHHGASDFLGKMQTAWSDCFHPSVSMSLDHRHIPDAAEQAEQALRKDEIALCLSKLPDLYFMWVTMDFVAVQLGGLYRCREANFVHMQVKRTLITLSWDAITLVLCWCALSSEFRIDMAREFHMMSYRRPHAISPPSSWDMGLFVNPIATGRHGPEVPKFVFMSVCFETHGHSHWHSIPQLIPFSVGSQPT